MAILTDTKLRALKPRGKLYRVADSGGLCIEVRPTGAKLWRFRYRHNGIANMLGIGSYPAVPLAGRADPKSGKWIEGARERRDEARKLLADGIDPSAQRKDDRRQSLLSASNTFEAVAREWFAKESGRWTAHHLADVERSLEREAFPAIGSKPIAELDAASVLECIKAIEKRGALEVAHRTAQRISAVCRYAVLTGRAKYNPAADLRGAIKTRKVEHMKAMPRDELPAFLQKLDDYSGRPETRIGLRLLALTFVRTGELRRALWKEIDFDNAEWRIPAERMKMREEHIVPLAPQTIAALRELHAITGQTPLLFPGRSNAFKPVSENTFLFALYRMGYHGRATGHGFRALASTTLNEQNWNPDVIERQLAHGERNRVRAAYNRAQYMEDRRKMMRAWANYLDAVRKGADVVPIKRSARVG
jgi:integrase